MRPKAHPRIPRRCRSDPAFLEADTRASACSHFGPGNLIRFFRSRRGDEAESSSPISASLRRTATYRLSTDLRIGAFRARARARRLGVRLSRVAPPTNRCERGAKGVAMDKTNIA